MRAVDIGVAAAQAVVQVGRVQRELELARHGGQRHQQGGGVGAAGDRHQQRAVRRQPAGPAQCSAQDGFQPAQAGGGRLHGTSAGMAGPPSAGDG